MALTLFKNFIPVILLVLFSCQPSSPEPTEKSAIESNSSEFDIRNWKNIDHVSGRTATQDDVDAGRASFVIDGGRSTAMEMEIPSVVVRKNEQTEEELIAIVIQAEQIGEHQLIGIRYADGRVGACPLSEITFVEDPQKEFDRFLSK